MCLLLAIARALACGGLVGLIGGRVAIVGHAGLGEALLEPLDLDAFALLHELLALADHELAENALLARVVERQWCCRSGGGVHGGVGRLGLTTQFGGGGGRRIDRKRGYGIQCAVVVVVVVVTMMMVMMMLMMLAMWMMWILLGGAHTLSQRGYLGIGERVRSRALVLAIGVLETVHFVLDLAPLLHRDQIEFLLAQRGKYHLNGKYRFGRKKDEMLRVENQVTLISLRASSYYTVCESLENYVKLCINCESFLIVCNNMSLTVVLHSA